MDKIDRKIIRKLFSDVRVSNNQIARQVGVSKEMVNYRLNRLKKRQVLQGFVTIINNHKIGYITSITYFKLQKVNHDREKEVIFKLSGCDFVKCIATCTGPWDMFVVTASKNMLHFNQNIVEYENIMGENLKKKRSAIILEEYFMPYDYITGSQRKLMARRQTREKVLIDRIDNLILESMSNDPYISLVELSKRIDLTPEATSYRIKSLIKKGVIEGFFPLVDITILGFHWYTVSLHLHNITAVRENELIKYLMSDTNIVVVIKTVGEWDIEFDVHIENSLKFRELLMDIREKFPDIINDLESNLIFNDYKYTHFPKGLSAGFPKNI
ncbi:MAG: Lrp/AsnC family transcriptional regulator [Nanoarchaeota archaeon]|nr:Lrp/AsnC family transcriptional regulator [Nanoarchaeota archaeon]